MSELELGDIFCFTAASAKYYCEQHKGVAVERFNFRFYRLRCFVLYNFQTLDRDIERIAYVGEGMERDYEVLLLLRGDS
ncbi:MAG: hypothetical protein JWP09_942 [Candidatus Taylorbacteria bacterium]|nr:hypothetical protein [Candidatus Taylorbacteria bacterium]